MLLHQGRLSLPFLLLQQVFLLLQAGCFHHSLVPLLQVELTSLPLIQRRRRKIWNSHVLSAL